MGSEGVTGGDGRPGKKVIVFSFTAEQLMEDPIKVVQLNLAVCTFNL